MNLDWGSITEHDPEKALAERVARLQERREALARLPHHTLSDGSVATVHRIRGNSGSHNHAVAEGKWKAACGASPMSSSWSTALEDVVTCPRCLKKIAQ